MTLYYIDEEALARVERVMTRLYSERHMTADDMRDHAHLLWGVVEDVRRSPA